VVLLLLLVLNGALVAAELTARPERNAASLVPAPAAHTVVVVGICREVKRGLALSVTEVTALILVIS
jgi:hypothetical protein